MTYVGARQGHSEHQGIWPLQQRQSNTGDHVLVVLEEPGEGKPAGDAHRDEARDHQDPELGHPAPLDTDQHGSGDDRIEPLLHRQGPQVPHVAVLLHGRFDHREPVGEHQVVDVEDRRGAVLCDTSEADPFDARQFADDAQNQPDADEEPD
ncbi:MAG: hypothetical protein R2735_01580 [Microthrixaceae bacterium]